MEVVSLNNHNQLLRLTTINSLTAKLSKEEQFLEEIL